MKKFLPVVVVIIVGLIILSLFLSRWKENQDTPTATTTQRESVVTEYRAQSYKHCVTNFPPELCAMYSAEERVKLYSTCSQLEIPATEHDTTLYPETKIVVARWRDHVNQNDVTVYLPYEPESGFANCSESVKSLLRSIQESSPR